MAVFNPIDFVLEHMVNGTSEKEIRRILSESHGMNPDAARSLISQVKASHPQAMALRQDVLKDIRRGEKKTWFLPVIIGSGLVALGVIITAITYAMAGPGGTFIVASGLALTGVLTILRGLWHLIRWW